MLSSFNIPSPLPSNVASNRSKPLLNSSISMFIKSSSSTCFSRDSISKSGSFNNRLPRWPTEWSRVFGEGDDRFVVGFVTVTIVLHVVEERCRDCEVRLFKTIRIGFFVDTDFLFSFESNINPSCSGWTSIASGWYIVTDKSWITFDNLPFVNDSVEMLFQSPITTTEIRTKFAHAININYR